MRSCMYCGRDLAKDELCNCAQSVRMRENRQQNTKTNQNSTNTQNQDAKNTSAHSGAVNTPPKKSWKERRAEKKASRPKKNRPYRVVNMGNGREFLSYIVSCIRTPVFKAANPGYVRMWWIWVLVGIQGFVVSMALALSSSTMGKGLFGLLSMTFGFKGVEGWKVLLNILVTAISGTAMGYIQFFIMCGIFFLIGKIILRSTVGYREYMERFVPCTVPLTAIGLAGIVFAVFSPSMLLILLACGVVLEVILLYEALRSYWHAKPDFMVYTIVGGLFVYAVLCYNIYKLLI